MLTVKSDDIVGRLKTYEAIVKGEEIPRPGIPEAFRVLTKELQSLGLDLKMYKQDEQLELKDSVETEIDEREIVLETDEDIAKLNQVTSGDFVGMSLDDSDEDVLDDEDADIDAFSGLDVIDDKEYDVTTETGIFDEEDTFDKEDIADVETMKAKTNNVDPDDLNSEEYLRMRQKKEKLKEFKEEKPKKESKKSKTKESKEESND
jgi:DNA-directed RNA polymerase subunit beta